MRLLTIAMLVVATTGCASMKRSMEPQYLLHYNIELTEVERPESAQQRYGPSRIASRDSAGVSQFTFEDSLIAALIYPRTSDFALRLENRSRNAIRLVWDEVSYVDTEGRSQRVMHAGIKYSEKSAPMPPSVIPRGGHIIDIVQPSDDIRMGYSTWIEPDLLPIRRMALSQRDSIVAEHRAMFGGKQMRVLLPIEIEGVTNEYVFSFTVKDVGAVPLTPAGMQ